MFTPACAWTIADVPSLGHAEPEYRVGAGDDLRANTELLERFFPREVLDEAEVLRAAPGGDRDLAWLLAPSRSRALELDKAYWLIVQEQSFTRGRDATLTPAIHVHAHIGESTTELAAAGTVFHDGALRLDWPGASPMPQP